MNDHLKEMPNTGNSFHITELERWHSVSYAYLTICLKTLDSLVLENDLSGTQRGINPSAEFARARCILAIMAFSSFWKWKKQKMLWQVAILLFHVESVGVWLWSLIYSLLAAAQHQESFNVVLLQISIPLLSKSRFYLVVPIQILQRSLGDVDTPEYTRHPNKHKMTHSGMGALQ